MPEYFDRGPLEIRKEQDERKLELLGVEPLEVRFSRDELHAAAHKMHIDGSFSATIADAYFLADSHNKRRILRSFPDLFLRHLDRKETL